MMMIKTFFKFKNIPFAKDIPTKQIFLSNSLKELLSRFDYLKQHRGLMLLTGQPGVGKSLALRSFVDSLNPNLYFIVYLPLTTISELEFYRQLCFQLTGQTYHRKTTCFNTMQNAIIDLVKNNKKVPVIIIDEAHLLLPQNLHEIQIILNFDIDSTDPALFILSGQTHLKDIISRPVHKSLNQRFSLKYTLMPLEKQEIKNYIIHHLSLVGCKEQLFSDSAIEALYLNSAGNPRDLGNLALKALTAAASLKKSNISEEEVYAASKEI
ncbi:MAG: AAA family ATPase [Candidatus Omnitrophota bacterium]